MLAELDQALENIRTEVNEAILEGDFEKVLPYDSTYTIRIKVRGIIADIWNSNEPSSTCLYSFTYDGLAFDVRLGTGKPFKKPATVRKILRTLAPEEKKIKQKELQNKIKQLQEELDDQD